METRLSNELLLLSLTYRGLKKTKNAFSVIPVAVATSLEKSRQHLEWWMKVVQWQDGDENFMPDYGRNLWLIVMLPSAFGELKVSLFHNAKMKFLL
jgi:hypothetical protein